MRTRWLSAVALVVPALVVAACGGTPGQKKAEPSTIESAAQNVKTDGFESLGRVTLRVVTSETGTGPKKAIQEMSTAFEKKYPSVTVKVSYRDFSSWIKQVKLSLASKNPWSPDGKTFGTGTLYGIAQSGQSTGVFANKAKLEVVERLGSESHVIFPVEAPALTGEAAVAADEATEEGDATLLAGDTPTRFTARVEGRRRLSPGDDAGFAIDPATIHLFDPETSLALR